MWNDRDGRMLCSPYGDCGNDNNSIGTHSIEISGEHMTTWWNSLDQSSARSNYQRPPQTLYFCTLPDKKRSLKRENVCNFYFFFVLWKITFQVSSINEITTSVSNFIYWPRNILSYKKISLSLKHSYLYTTYVCIEYTL